MTNKIDGPRLAPLPPPATAESADRKARASADERISGAAPSDSVRLTDASSELAAAARSAGEGAPFDAARVEKVRAALADGSFKIDANRIADRLLATEQDLPK